MVPCGFDDPCILSFRFPEFDAFLCKLDSNVLDPGVRYDCIGFNVKEASIDCILQFDVYLLTKGERVLTDLLIFCLLMRSVIKISRGPFRVFCCIGYV